MKQPEEMTLAELRAELRQTGVTEPLTKLILREMSAAEQRVLQAMQKDRDAKGKYDPLRAQLFVLKAHGMTDADLSLNRKGKLFITLTTREEVEQSAQSA
jgi:hypothetical protein